MLADAGIVRNRAKVEAVINNARCAVELVHRQGSIASYVWRFEPESRARLLDRESLRLLSQTDDSKALARDLKRRGWRFVGPTTVYAFMQAMGLVNDHIDGCDPGAEAQRARERFHSPAGGGPLP